MTRDDIIRMAADAGFEISKSGMPIVRHSSGAWVGVADRIERFANLVAAAEREACAVAVETQDTYGDPVGGWFDILATKIRQRGQP